MSLEDKNNIINGLKATVDAQQKLIERYEKVLKYYAYDAESMQDGGDEAGKVLEN